MLGSDWGTIPDAQDTIQLTCLQSLEGGHKSWLFPSQFILGAGIGASEQE